MTPEGVLVGAPASSAGAGIIEAEQLLAAEAVVAYVSHGALGPCFVLGMLLARRIDVEAARLRVLEEADRSLPMRGPSGIGSINGLRRSAPRSGRVG